MPLLNGKFLLTVLISYFLIISLISVIVTVYDKIRAVKGKWRVPEATLLTLSALGGSLAMYITMKIIHHKTRHVKFMYGIPVIMISQLAIIIYVFYRVQL